MLCHLALVSFFVSVTCPGYLEEDDGICFVTDWTAILHSATRPTSLQLTRFEKCPTQAQLAFWVDTGELDDLPDPPTLEEAKDILAAAKAALRDAPLHTCGMCGYFGNSTGWTKMDLLKLKILEKPSLLTNRHRVSVTDVKGNETVFALVAKAINVSDEPFIKTEPGYRQKGKVKQEGAFSDSDTKEQHVPREGDSDFIHQGYFLLDKATKTRHRVLDVSICTKCQAELKSARVKKQGMLPYRSLAYLDWGTTANLPKLSFYEKLCISKFFPMHFIKKIKAADGSMSSSSPIGCRLHGHVLLFKNNATEAMANTLSLPRTDIPDFVQIMLVGTRNMMAAIRQAVKGHPDWIVDVRKVITWLRFLKSQKNSIYADVIIPETESEIEDAAQSLIEQRDKILDAATEATDDITLGIEKKVGSNMSLAHPQDEKDDPFAQAGVIPGVASSLVMNTDSLPGYEELVLNALAAKVLPPPEDPEDPDDDAAASAAIAADGNGNGDGNSDGDGDGDGAGTGYGDGAGTGDGNGDGDGGSAGDGKANAKPKPAKRKIKVRIAGLISEFDNMPDILNGAFPWLFPLPLDKVALNCNVALSLSIRERLFGFYDQRFAQEPGFLFYTFNNLMRMKAIHNVNLHLSSDSEIANAFLRIVNAPGFDQQLMEALVDPLCKESKLLLSKLLPLIRITSSKLPWSPFQRQNMLPFLYAMSQQFNAPYLYLTTAPHPMDDAFTLRLATRSSEPDLPADLLNDTQRRSDIITRNPVDHAVGFHHRMCFYFSTLLGTPWEGDIRKSVSLLDRKRGAWGPVTSASAAVETNARASLHAHITATVSGVTPTTIPFHTSDEGYLTKLASYTDAISQAHFTDSVINEDDDRRLDLLFDIETNAADRKAHLPPRFGLEDILEDPIDWQEVVEQGERIGVVLGDHRKHHKACYHKNKKRHQARRPCHCRMGYERPIHPATAFLQIEADGTSFNVLDDIDPPPVADFSVLSYPLDPEDSRVLIYSIARPTVRSVSQVPINPLCTVVNRCSSCDEVNGSGSQANSAIFYQLKYITKNDHELAHSISVYRQAWEAMQQFPSKADDAGTELRNAKYFATKVLNKGTAAAEYSDTVAACAILDFPADYCTHSSWYVYIQPALAYQRDLRGDRGLYGDADDSDEDGAVESDHDDSDPDVDALNDTISELANAGASGSSEIYRTKSDGTVVLNQHTHFRYRGAALRHLGYYEYCNLVSIVPKPKPSKSAAKKRAAALAEAAEQGEAEEAGDGADGSGADDNDAKAQERKRGRPRSSAFDFTAGHALCETHTQKLLSKRRVGILCGAPPPSFPRGRRPLTLFSREYNAWMRQANICSEYAATLLMPWDDDTGIAPHQTYDSFAAEIKTWTAPRVINNVPDGDHTPTFINAHKYRYLNNILGKLKVRSSTKTLVSKYRNSKATNLDEYFANIRAHDGVQDPQSAADDVERDDAGMPGLNDIDENDAKVDEFCATLQAAADSDARKANGLNTMNNYLDMCNTTLSKLWNVGDDEVDVNMQSIEADSGLLPSGAPRPATLPWDSDARDASWCDAAAAELFAPRVVDPSDQKMKSSSLGAARDIDYSLLKENLKPFSVGLTKGQRQALHAIAQDINSGKQVQTLLHGPPGCGKSFLIARVIKALDHLYGINARCCATTGAAASLLAVEPRATTWQHLLGLGRFNKGLGCRRPRNNTGSGGHKAKDDKKKDVIKPGHKPISDAAKAKITSHLEGVSLLILDEASMLTADELARISTILSFVLDNESPFGGLNIILVADFFQFPPVGKGSMSMAKLAVALTKQTAVRSLLINEQIRKGTALFIGFRRLQLGTTPEEIKRNEGDAHLPDITHKLRKKVNNHQPITSDILNHIKQLKPSDLQDKDEGASWQNATFAVTSNVEVDAFNSFLLNQYALRTQQPTFYWYSKIRDANKVWRDDHLRCQLLATAAPELRRSFAIGAPCVIAKNHNPSIGVANGTRAKMHMLVFSDEDQLIVDAMDRSNWLPGAEILVPEPLYVIVTLKDGTECPLPNIPEKCELGGSLSITFRNHRVEIGFATTFHKLQGDTYETGSKLVLVCNPRHSVKLLKVSFESLYVGITRVKRLKDLRFFPMSTSDLREIMAIKRPSFISEWDRNYNKQGYWIGGQNCRMLTQMEKERSALFKKLKATADLSTYTVVRLKEFLTVLNKSEALQLGKMNKESMLKALAEVIAGYKVS